MASFYSDNSLLRSSLLRYCRVLIPSKYLIELKVLYDLRMEDDLILKKNEGIFFINSSKFLVAVTLQNLSHPLFIDFYLIGSAHLLSSCRYSDSIFVFILIILVLLLLITGKYTEKWSITLSLIWIILKLWLAKLFLFLKSFTTVVNLLSTFIVVLVMTLLSL